MKKFLKDTRGVVMMEYIILGLFAVAITVAAVHALGKVYNNGLLAMSYATLGATNGTVNVVEGAVAKLAEEDYDAITAYGNALTSASNTAAGNDILTWTVYDAN